MDYKFCPWETNKSVMQTGWHTSSVGNMGNLQLQGSWINHELRLLSIWSFVYSPHVLVSSGFSGFTFSSQNMMGGELDTLGLNVWVYGWL